MTTEELFEKPELKVIEEEEPMEVKVVDEPKKDEEPVPLNSKGKPRKRLKNGGYRVVKEKTPEQKKKMLEALAKGREKAREVRLMKGRITRQKKMDKDAKFKEEYLKTIGKEDESKSNELNDVKAELKELKELIKQSRQNSKPSVTHDKVVEKVDAVVAPVSESVVVDVPQPTPSSVEKVPDTLPVVIPPKRKSLRPKSIWSQFV